MYAVIKSGGKQYRVRPGDVIRVEKVENDAGAEFDLTDVILLGDVKGEPPVMVGKPLVSGAKVTVVVQAQTKDKKVIVFKKKRRQGYRRLKGHRQPFTELFVKAISLNDQIEKSSAQAKIRESKF